MECNPTLVTNRFSRKRRRDPTNWQRNVAKKMRYSSKSVPERVCNHMSKSLQCAKLTMDQIMKLHRNFYARPEKKEQDALILKYCSIQSTANHKTGFKGQRQTATKYSVLVDKGKKVPICKKFFLSIFGITKHRVAYVMNRLYYTSEFPSEKRGGNHKEHKYAAQKESIHKFIQKLKCVESHYCRKSKFAVRQYLPSELNINKLFKIYKDSEFSIPLVKNSYFRSIFNNYYNIGFGSPKTDVCSTCLELKEKIKLESDPQKKNELITQKRVHMLRANAFFEKLREESDGLKIISFDCQKNLPLPKLPDQSTYYSRQLYFYNFTMVEGSSTLPFSKERIFSYVCIENEHNKDSNLVSSAVYHRLTETDKTNIDTIRLIADGCGGQNKNCILVGTCCNWLLKNLTIKKIEIVFPVTGHSYMPADRVFGVIEKKLKKLEVILHPSEIKDIITQTASLVELGTECPVKDWRQSIKNIVKQTTSWPMKFKECKRFILKRSKKPGNVLVRGEIFYKSDIAAAVNVCQKGKNMSMIEPQILPCGVPVNKKKLEDVNKLLVKHFGPEWKEIQFLAFYDNLLITQESLNAPSEEQIQDYCEEPLDDARDLRI
ncbi:hypothetical protein evm_005713 [Chilo suppressalis]|nr:hypothetical protein evm_005713 [Chilo suppressalis]